MAHGTLFKTSAAGDKGTVMPNANKDNGLTELTAHVCAREAKICREFAVSPRLPTHAILLRAMAETWDGMAVELRRLDNVGALARAL